MSDANLIKGAHRVAKAQRKMEMADVEGINTVLNAGYKALGDIVDKKKSDSGDWTEKAHKILDKAGELPNAEYMALFDNLDGKYKEAYEQAVKDGDKQKQAMILKDVADMGRDYADYKDFLYNLSQDYVSGTLSNHMLHYDREGMHIMKLLEPGFANLVEKECEEGVPCDTEMGVYFPDFELIDEAQNHISILESQINSLYRKGFDTEYFDGTLEEWEMMESLQAKLEQYNAVLNDNPQKWISLQTLKSKKQRKDKSSSDILFATLEQAYNNAYNSTPDDPAIFDKEHARRKLENAILAKGDFKSIIHDEMIPGRIFYDDFLKMIQGEMAQGITYADLGVTDEQLADADVNKDDEVSEDEAKNLLDFIINDKTESDKGKTMIHEYVSNYFLNIFETNHNNGITNMMNLSKNKKQKQDEDKEDDITSLSFNSNAPRLT